MDDDSDRTASLMTPARLAQLKVAAKAPASSSAWLDQLAADAGSGHVRRLLDLRKGLEAQSREGSLRGMHATVEALAAALQQLDFALLQPKGWLARATGKGKEAGAGFAAQVDCIGRAGEDLQDELRGLQKQQQAQAGATERALLEMEVELKALEKIIEQGTRWLQDMRNKIKAREAKGGTAGEQQQMEQDAARCELLVARLKLLRAASSAAQQGAERCRAATARRAALAGLLQKTVDGDWSGWQQRIAPVRSQAASSGAATEGVEQARAMQQALLESLRQAAQDCLQVQSQERALADELAALQEPLQAAA